MEIPDNSDVIIILFVGALSIISLALGILFFFIFYQKKLHKNELQINSIKAEHQKELLKNSLLAQENERKRFAEDLHDEVGAYLSAIKLSLSRIAKKTENEDTQGLANETKIHVDSVISHIRRITRNLLPPSLEKLGLAKAINEFANWVNKSSIFVVDTWITGKQIRFTPKYEMVVYRVFQELTNNAIKYSKAKTITVKLKFSGNYLYLSVCDNGKGFNMNESKNSGLGLKNIESRLSLLNGKYKITSKINKGTIAIVSVNISGHILS